MSKTPFDPQIFINSLPKGFGQREDEFSIVASYGTSVGTDLILKYALIVVEELDLDNPNWNPNFTLDEWCVAFGIDDLIKAPNTERAFRNYLVRFYNRVLLSRPFPISLKKLNALFDEYPDLGVSIKFDNDFIIGHSVLGGEEYLGLPGSSSVLSLDPKAKYFEYYSVVVRLLLRILPLNASIKVDSPFDFSGEIPPYNTFQIVHDCNAPYQALETQLIYAQGDFEINQSSVLSLELYNFLVKSEVIFDLVPFRSSGEIPSLYLSFFILNSTAQVITVNLTLQDPTQEALTYTLSNIPSDRWTAVLIKISDLANANNIKSLSLQSDQNINDSHNQFYIDQVRVYTGEDSVSSNIYIEQEIAKKIIT